MPCNGGEPALHNSEMPDRTPRRNGRGGGGAWPRAALQRPEALEPAPFVPQRLGLHPLEAPKPVTACPRVVATACALPAARRLGAETERSQQVALRTPNQFGARAQ